MLITGNLFKLVHFGTRQSDIWWSTLKRTVSKWASPNGMLSFFFYRLPTKLGEANVFTGVCPSFCPQLGGEWVSLVPGPFRGMSLVPGPFWRWVCLGALDNGIRSASGWYASYWNSFLLREIIIRYHLHRQHISKNVVIKIFYYCPQTKFGAR